MNRTAITSMEGLRNWWDLDPEAPYFTIYRGRSSKATEIIHRNATVTDHDQAWEMLEQIIDTNSGHGGEFTVLRNDKPTTGYGKKVVIIMDSPHRLPAVAGMPAPAVPGMPYVGATPEAIQGYIAEQIQKERQSWELEKKVADLEAAIQAGNQGSFIERTFDRITQHEKFDSILDVLLVRLLNPKGAPQPTHVAVSGVPQDHGDGFMYDTQRIHAALERIRAHFPDIHATLDRLAEFCDRNPEMAKNLLNQI